MARAIPHQMCLMVGHHKMSHYGFPSESNLTLGYHDWRVGSGTCDCDCETCLEVHGPDADGKTFFIYRYLYEPGRQVAKVTIL